LVVEATASAEEIIKVMEATTAMAAATL